MKAKEATNGHAGELTNRLPDQAKDKKEEIRISPLRQAVLTVPIVGETPLKVLRFSKKKQDEVEAKHRAGDQAKTKKKKGPKDFEEDYEQAKYVCTQQVGGKQVKWLGLNATGIRNGCIKTCGVAGFVMTKAKMSIFCIADGIDDLDHSTPLVRIEGEPVMVIDPVRNDSGVIDLRSRVAFPEWRINVRIRFDEDQFSPSDILNLLIRVGQQNGLGEGRPNGRDGNGTGNGLFRVAVEEASLERLATADFVLPKLG